MPLTADGGCHQYGKSIVTGYESRQTGFENIIASSPQCLIVDYFSIGFLKISLTAPSPLQYDPYWLHKTSGHIPERQNLCRGQLPPLPHAGTFLQNRLHSEFLFRNIPLRQACTELVTKYEKCQQIVAFSRSVTYQGA